MLHQSCSCIKKIIAVVHYYKKRAPGRDYDFVQARAVVGYYDGTAEEVRKYGKEQPGSYWRNELQQSGLPFSPNKLPNGEESIHGGQKIVEGYLLLELDFIPLNGNNKGTVRERDVTLIELH